MGRSSGKRAAFSCIIADNLIKCSIVTVLVERCTILGGSFKKETDSHCYHLIKNIYIHIVKKLKLSAVTVSVSASFSVKNTTLVVLSSIQTTSNISLLSNS